MKCVNAAMENINSSLELESIGKIWLGLSCIGIKKTLDFDKKKSSKPVSKVEVTWIHHLVHVASVNYKIRDKDNSHAIQWQEKILNYQLVHIL